MSRRPLLGALALSLIGLVLIAVWSLSVGRFPWGVDEADAPAASAPSSVAHGEAPGEGQTGPRPTTPVTVVVGQAPSALTLTPGTTWEESLEASFGGRALGGEIDSRLVLTGRRYGICYRASADAVLIGLRTEVEVVQGDERVASLAEELAAEVLVALDRRNRITHVGLPGDVSAEARNLQRSLLALGAFALPPRPGAERWQEEGVGPSGSFKDDYTRGATEVARARTYTAIRGLKGEGARFEASGTAWAELDPSGLPSTFTAEERLTISSGDSQLVLESRLALRRSRRSEHGEQAPEARLAAVEASLGANPWSTSLEPEQGGAGARPPPEIGDVLADLTRAGRGERLREQAPRIFLGLVRRLRLDQDALAPTLIALRDASRPLDARSTILDALGEAGTARAQLALVELLEGAPPNEGLPADLLPSLFLALGASRQPLPEVVRALEGAGYVGDPARERDPERAAWATRAAGILAGRVADPAQADALAEGLSRALGPDPQADLVLLGALGNAGREASLPSIAPYLSAKEDALRAAAVAALRKLQPAKVEALVLERLKRDPNPDVRREAVRTLGELSAVRASVREGALAALRDAVPEVRRQAVAALSGWLDSPSLAAPDRDALVVALRGVARGDADAGVQAVAREALGR